MQKRPLLISFSGIDGAGKSTQIANLQRWLADAGLEVALFTFWDDIARLKSFREQAGQKVFGGDAGVGSPEAPITRMDKNIRSPWMTAVRLGLYLVDALSTRLAATRALRLPVDVVIFDRFLLDELANLNLAHPFQRAYVRFLSRLVPRLDLSLILDADPEQARARKPEYPLDFLHHNRNAYLSLHALLGTTAVISPAPLEAAQAQVTSRVRELLATR